MDKINVYINDIKKYYYGLTIQYKKDFRLLMCASMCTFISVLCMISMFFYQLTNLFSLFCYISYLSVIHFIVSFMYFFIIKTRDKYLYSILLIKTRIWCLLSIIILIVVLFLDVEMLSEYNFIFLFAFSNILITLIASGNLIYQKKIFSEEKSRIIKIFEKISNAILKVKCIRRAIYINDIIFFILLTFIILDMQRNIIVMECIFFLVLLLSILIIQDDRKEKIVLDSYNINYNDIKNHSLYIYNDDCIKKDKYFKIVKIDLNNIFPENVTEKEIILLNYACIANEGTNKQSTSIYLCIPLFKKDRNIPLEVLQEYKIENENRKVYKKFKMYIEVKEYNNELLPITIGMIFNVTKYRHRDKYVVNHDVDFKFTYSTNRFISSTILKKGQLLNDKINDDRCFLKHEGAYGNGKTISDIYMIASANRIPVIISPWEENYDHDILYLIFKKIKRATNTKSHSFSKEYFAFYFSLIVAVAVFVLGNNDTLCSVFMPNTMLRFFQSNNNLRLIGNLSIFIVIIPFIVFLIIKIIIPGFIVFKKDYTKIYQEFFIEEIYKMIQMNSEICLLIEDIDRLSEEAYNNVFRTLSSINKKCQRSNRIIGILSYASDNINDDLLYDLENKICYKEVNFSNERHQQKMNIIRNVLLHNGVNTNGIKEYLSKINDDIEQITFRDLNKLIDECFVKQNHFKVYLFYDNLRYIAKKKKEEKQKILSSSQIQNNIMVNM